MITKTDTTDTNPEDSFDDERQEDQTLRRLASCVMSIAEAKRQLSDLCSRVGYGRDTIVLTKRGKPLAAIVSIADLEHYLALGDQRAAKLLEQAVATSPGVEKLQEERHVVRSSV